MANLSADELQRRLLKALKVGGDLHGPEDILKAVQEGRMQSWTKNESLIVTEVMVFPKGCVLNVVLAVGTLDDVLSLQPDMMEFGRQHGATRLRMSGRKGWDAILPGEGWTKVPQVIYERTL